MNISEAKTKITNSYKDKIRFLGTDIRHAQHTTFSTHIRGYRQRNRRALLLTAPMSRIKAKLADSSLVKHNRGITRVSWLPLNIKQIIHQYNNVLRGYANYYSFAHNRPKLHSWLFYTIRDSAARTIAHKMNLKRRAKVYQKYGPYLTIIDYQNRTVNGKPKYVTSLFKPTLKINVWDFKTSDVHTDVPALFYDSISLANLEDLSCTACQSKYRVEMHHVRMMKDLAPLKHKLDYLMAKANRKQIPLCRECHMKYHAGKLIIPDAQHSIKH